MPERKVWTQQEDKILRLLRQERGERKWANIARIMQTEFNIAGRTGKQCRERYHNHLDSNIVSTEWTEQEEEILYEMHEQYGNKWSIISQKLPGRSDNCVKNHFYSKLRRALRRLNKYIVHFLQEQFLPIRDSILSKIIKTTDSKFKNSSKIDEELAEFCNDIKNRLYRFSLAEEEHFEQLEEAKQLITDIHHFDRDFKKGYRGLKFQYDPEGLLKPPPKLIKRSSSARSWSSAKSDDSCSSYLSSCSLVSSSDFSDVDLIEDHNKLSKTTGGQSRASSSRNSGQMTVKSQMLEKGNFFGEKMEVGEGLDQQQQDSYMEPEKFQQEYQDLVEQENSYYQAGGEQIHYNNMIYDDTPVIARILGPNPFAAWPPKQQSNQEEELEEKMDKLGLEM